MTATATAPTLLEIPHLFFMGQDRLKGPFPPELLAPDYQAEVAGFPPMDAEGHAAFARVFYAAFPDIHHTLDEVVATDDGAAVRFTLRGTHTGDFMGIAPTGRAITVSAIVLLAIADGRVARLRAIFDRFGLMQQIGVIPA
ncbi:MAG TPA: ester cyclase [Longimicrobium sp.]